ncbi:pyridoxamine 5'-phosphate oxidase family protein [Streptomyces sp. 4N509B]|uniref:pyridoxamine 5'-phosphate oxidase family protein n=1 Tax=Streptomyces sp. 4N509B TaxID=3457413 RepID=UPI003FD3DFD5
MAKQRPPARDGQQRRGDVLTRLVEDVDAWVSTTGQDERPCMVPLSFVWHDGALLMSTRTVNPTARNVRRSGRAVVALGHTRDVVLIDADAEAVPSDALPDAEGQAFHAKLGWDTRDREEYCFLRFRPRAIRAWREANELPGRELMVDGVWLV